MSIPAYRIITDDLLQAITDGRLKPGDRILMADGTRELRVEKVEDVMEVGDTVMVKVYEIDSQNRINLVRAEA